MKKPFGDTAPNLMLARIRFFECHVPGRLSPFVECHVPGRFFPRSSVFVSSE